MGTSPSNVRIAVLEQGLGTGSDTTDIMGALPRGRKETCPGTYSTCCTSQEDKEIIAIV
jgi:hypothetical protein